MKLALILGDVSSADHGWIDPENVFNGTHRALTGSEGSLLNLARELAKRHTVIVYCRSRFEFGTFDGIHYRHSELGVDPDHDFYVAMSEPDLLNGAPAGKRICWQQQNNFDYVPKGYDEFVDIYVALSPVHREHMVKVTETNSGKWVWVPNGIDTERFARELPRRPHSMAWLSSPDRGLHHLLSMWPEIREQVPDANLRIFYRFDPWITKVTKGPRMTRGSSRAAYIRECLHRLGRKGENGVTVIGDVPNAQMAEELLQTQVFAYTCDPVAFTEGFGVSVLDAIAAGCEPIVSGIDALGDIYADVADVIPDRPGDRRGRWIAQIVAALQGKASPPQVDRRQWSRAFDIGHVAQLWERLFSESTSSAHRMPQTIREYVGGVDVSIDSSKPPQAPEASRFDVASSKLRIDYVLGPSGVYPRHGGREFDPRRLLDAPRGLSGTDINFFGSAFAMARRGHTVRVFTPMAHEGLDLDGVHFHNYERFGSVPPGDVAIAHYDGLPLREARHKLHVVVQHTILIPSPEIYTGAARIDLSLSPSARNMRELKAKYNPDGQWDVLPNANDYGTFLPHNPVPGRLVFHTSPERGLHRLLAALPEIRKRVPHAHLVVITDLEPLRHFHQFGPRHGEIAQEIQAGLARNADGVTLIPRSSRNAVLAELSKVALFAYPSDPPQPCEVAPVSVLDCLRAGVPVVCKPADGIEDMFGDAISTVDSFRDFVDATVDMLTHPEIAAAQAFRGRSFVEAWSFYKQATRLENILCEQLGLAGDILPPRVPMANVPQLPAYEGL